MKKSRTDWSKVDWSQSTSAIVKQTGKSQGRVSNARAHHALETVGKTRCQVTKAGKFWRSIDWTKKSPLIAAETGYSHSMVCLMRKKYQGDGVVNL